MSDRLARNPFFTPLRLALLTVAVAGLIIIALVGLWLLRHQRLEWSIDRGLTALAETNSPVAFDAALDLWEQNTAPYWRNQRPRLTERLFNHHDLANPHVRALLERVSGVSYGDRLDDWRRWYDNHRRIAAGRRPDTPRRQEIEIEALWEAPVGLTAWFTTILPLGQQIYVPSLGTTLADTADDYDGVVRVDGQTGEAALVFTPPDRAPRDILGLALANGKLIAACRNGFVYELTPMGELQRYFYAAGTIVSPPLTIDLNDNGTEDLIVVTKDGKVVAFSGETASTPWVRHLPGGPPATGPNQPLVSVGMATGDLHPQPGPEIAISTLNGELYILSAARGEILWRYGLAPGNLAAPLTFSNTADAQAPLFVADGAGRLWAAVRDGRRYQPQAMPFRHGRAAGAAVAALRCLDTGPDLPPWIIYTAAGNWTDAGGTVSAVSDRGLRWRYQFDGVLWAAPAIGDVNADEESELVVPTLRADDNGAITGRINFLSRNGHCLHYLDLDAAVECAPVLADTNADARMELLVADQAGYLRSYALRGRRQIEWGAALGDGHNTQNALNAYSWGQRPANLRWRWQPDF